MKYALLIYAAEKDWAAKSKEEQGAICNEYWAQVRRFIERRLQEARS